MKKPVYEVLSASYLLAFTLVMLIAPVYYYEPGNVNYFRYCSLAGATLLSYGGGILLFLLFALGVVKIVFAFLFKDKADKEEQYQFAVYSVWIILSLGLTMVSFQSASMIAFILALVLALSGLGAFFLDYHLYGQD